ncbi:MAG: hypothetical protein PHV18_06700 [Lachnospiraceae bacterium]|nr:hypothetical protein [Lachnospiraceae bacterium]
MSRKTFTPSEVELLRQNPYTADVCPTHLYYTLAFKEYAIRAATRGDTSIKIFSNAGYDPEVLGKPRIYAAMKSFKREAASPQGLHESRHSSEARLDALAKKDLSRQQSEKAIRKLQERVIHLEQQIEFLKKIQFINPKPPKK